ncbi:MAG: hypothetical protein IT385_11140 [Deltaproteobacteria bacterium]|nr:hypothetical protein [Deltaproteobacteria bacterium]
MDAPPLVMSPIVREWRCHQRGGCCRGHSVRLDAVEQRRIHRALVAAGDPRADLMAEGRLAQDDGWRLLPTVGGACVFLDEGLCGLRRTDPRAAYPSVCQRFPYLSILTPDRHLLGLTLACPTALQLFADEPAFEIVEEPGGEPPTDYVSWVAQPDRDYTLVDGRATDADSFWAAHWDWLARLRRRPEADPVARVLAFAEEVTGQARPSATPLSELLWARGPDDAALDALAAATGHRPSALSFIWSRQPGDDYADRVVTSVDEAALLGRYLLHRMLVPPVYVARADLRVQLVTLLAVLVRWRAARARGKTPIDAARSCDRMIIHSPTIGALAADLIDGRAGCRWRTLASLVA